MGRLSGHRPQRAGLRSLVVLLGCAAAAAAGCTTMQPVGQQSAAAGIESGDTVVVSLRDGREVELAFTDWTSEGLTGTDESRILQKIDNESIAGVEVERVSVLGSIGVVAAVLGVVLAAAGDASQY